MSDDQQSDRGRDGTFGYGDGGYGEPASYDSSSQADPYAHYGSSEQQSGSGSTGYGSTVYGGAESQQGYGQSYGGDQGQAYGQGYGQPSEAAPAYAPAGGGYGGGDNPYGSSTPATVESKFNVFGLIALIVGIIGLLIAWTPFGWVAIFFALVAVGLGITGLVIKSMPQKMMATFGLILGAVSLIVGIIAPFIWAAVLVNAASNTLSTYASYDPYPSSTYGEPSTTSSTTGSSGAAADGVADIEITITASSPISGSVSVDNYLSGSDKVDVDEKLTKQPSPYHYTTSMKLETKYDLSNVMVLATAENLEQVTCEVKVDGRVVATDTSTMAVCSASNLAG